MRKLTALCFSMLLCAGFTAQAGIADKAAKGVRNTASTEKVGKILPALQDVPVRTAGGNEIAPGLFKDQKTAFVQANKKPSKVTPLSTVESENIYGNVIYPSTELVKVGVDGTLTQQYALAAGTSFTTFGIKDGKLFGFMLEQTIFGLSDAWFRVYDLETGEYTDTSMVDNFATDFVQGGAYVPEEHAFYGYAYETWIKFDVETMSVVASTPQAANFMKQVTCNVSTGDLVAVDGTGAFFKLDKENGAHTPLFNCGYTSAYFGGLAYDMSSNNYLWNPITDTESEFIAVDANTGAATKLFDVDDAAEIGAMYVNETKPADPEAPMAAEFVSASFYENATTGTVTYKLPTLRNDEQAINGNIDYKFYINGNEYKVGQGAAGATVTINVGSDAALTDGNVVFNLVCYLGTHESKDAKTQVYIGNDVPDAPQNVKLTATTVSWNPVTTGIHNGYVDARKVTYTVEINGKTIAENISATSCPSGLAVNVELDNYVATVYANCNGLTSTGGVSNGIVFGEAYSEPVSFLPEEDQVKLFTIYDANSDAKTWSYYANSDAFRYAYNTRNDADDWLFLPPVKIEELGKLHKFAMDAWTQSASYPESFEVYVGREATPEAMTTEIIGETTINNVAAAPKTFEGFFKAEETGKYVVGVHATSTKNQYYLYANNFSIEVADVSVNGPGAVTDIVATPAAEGGLTATVEFKLPTKKVDGTAVSGTVTATVESDVDLKTVSGAPGSSQKVVVNTVQGDNELIIQTFQGDNHGMIVTANVYTGVDIPYAPQNVKITTDETNCAGLLTWTAPVQGANGGYIRPTGYTYYLCTQVATIFGTQWQIGEEIGTDVYEYAIEVPATQPQGAYALGVVAENEAGMGTTLGAANVSIGVPYSVPANETFPTETGLTYQALYIGSGVNGTAVSWALDNPAKVGEQYADDNQMALIGTCAGENYGRIVLPRFSTKGQNKVAFLPKFYLGSCKNIKITAESYDVAETEIADLSTVIGLDQTGYNELIVDLPAQFQDKGWVEVKVYAYFTPEKSVFVMDNYKFRNMVPNDLSVALQGTDKAYVGEKAEFSATVTSLGTSPAAYNGGKFTVTDAAGNVIAEKTMNSGISLPTDQSITVDWYFVPTIDQVGEYTVKFELSSSDDNNANNSATLSGTIAKGKAIVVDDLAAVREGANVNLTWTAPSISSGYESFEDMTPFEMSGTKIGEFTQVKHDEYSVYSWQGNAALKALLANVQYKAGFNVYNGPQLDEAFGQEGMWPATDGEQFIIAFCPGQQEDGTTPDADDWLISPAVKAGSTFSFDIRPLVNTYGKETIEICYATEDTTDPNAFTVLETKEIGDDNAEADPVWETVEFTVPENAKRVAIHYVSHDIFGICIDAISYTPIAGELKVAGYKVYRALAETPEFTQIGYVTTNAYTDVDTDETIKIRYYVVPVISDGSEGLQSNIAEVQANGIADLFAGQNIYGGKGVIVVKGFAGETVTVAAADGKVAANGVANDKNEINVAPGVYVVKAGKTVVKVVVK